MGKTAFGCALIGLTLTCLADARFAPPHAGLSLDGALVRVKDARARLEPAVAALEAKGLGAKSRASLAVIDDFLYWISDDCFQSAKERALREARELVLVAERAADRAEAILAGCEKDYPVPRSRLGGNVIDRAQVIGERLWPDGHTDRGPVFFSGFGHFQRVRTEVAKLPPLGLNFLQMEFGVRQVLPVEGKIDKGPLDNFARDAARAQSNNVAITVLLSPHYWPDWTFKKWPDLTCDCYAGFCPYHPAAREVLNRYFETLIPQIRDSPVLHSIVLSNEPSTRPNPKCPRVRAAFAAWLDKRYGGDIVAYGKLTGTNYVAFADVPVPNGVDNKTYSVELADFVRFSREFFADWHRWMAERVRALAPGVPLHVKIQAHCLNWSDSNPPFYSIDPVAFGRMSDYNGNDCVVSSEETASGEWVDNWWDMEAAYDLQRTSVDKPIVNSENHLQRDNSDGVYQPGAHTYASLWQNALHGQNGSALWCWERTFDPKSIFNGLILERPEAFEAYSHCALDLMRLADKIAQLQNLPPRILLLWSTAYFLDGGRTRFAAAHRAANFLGEQLGIVSEEMLSDYGASGGLATRPFDTAHVLLVPKTARAQLPAAAQRGLERFRDEGGVVLDDLPTQEHRIFETLTAMRSKLPGVSAPIVTSPDRPGEPVFGVETRGLRQGRQTLLSICNWTRETKRIRLESTAKDLVTGRDVPQEYDVKPLQIQLLQY